MRGGMAFVAAAAIILVAPACGGGTGGTGGTTSPSAPASASAPVTTAPPTATASSVSATEKDFAIALGQASVAPGQITFDIKNDGPSTHEFVAVRTDLADDTLPVKKGSVDEEDPKVLHVDEKEDIAGGTSASLAVTLAPGHYVFFCNLPGHYLAGMHTALTVTGTAAAASSATTEKDFAITAAPVSGFGVVNFDIHNDGPSTHEFVVFATDLAPDKLPVKNGAVVEDAPSVDHIGEHEDIEPGSDATLSLYLQPGSYVLICNLPGHYLAGMHAAFTVNG